MLKNNANLYWSNFFIQYKQEINALRNLVENDSEQAARYRRLAIFPLGNMPTMFLAGYIIGEARPITLFHRDRSRNGGTWRWSEEPDTRTIFSWSHNIEYDTNTDTVMLALEITANLTEVLIPESIRDLPRITVAGDKHSQTPFGSINDFDKLRTKMQEAINYAQDTIKATNIHIVCIAPAVAVFALGQKFQRRNSAQLHIYQVGKDDSYYPVFSFNRQTISMTNNPESKIEL